MFGPRSNSILKRFALLVIVVCATIITATGVARADGYLTNQEKFVGDEISGVFCDYIDSAGVTDASMSEAVRKADRAARRNAMQRADYDSANVRVTHSGRMSYSVNVVFY